MVAEHAQAAMRGAAARSWNGAQGACEYTTTELADLFGVARSTVYRAIQREAAAKLGDGAKNGKSPSIIGR